MKKYLILGLALIMTSLVFYSCEKEKVEIQPNDLSTTYRTSNSDYNFLPPQLLNIYNLHHSNTASSGWPSTLQLYFGPKTPPATSINELQGKFKIRFDQ